MTDTQVSDAVVFPEDDGTGVPDEQEDYTSAGYFALIAQASNDTYVGGGLEFTNIDTANNNANIASGHAFIQESGTSVQSGAQASYDTTLPSDSTKLIVLPTNVTLSLDVDAVNDIYIAEDSTSNDSVYVRHGSSVSEPADPSIYLGTINTSNGSTTRTNDGRTIPYDIDVSGTLSEQNSRVATRTWSTNNNIAHGDLSGISSNDHHAKYTDSEAISAINNDADHGSTASHNYFSGNHADLTNVTASQHHTRYSDEEAQDSVGTILGSQFTYDDTTPAITLNQGDGSGLNADTLDGLHLSSFANNTRTFTINSSSGSEYFKIAKISDGGSFEQGRFRAVLDFATDNGSSNTRQAVVMGAVRTSSYDLKAYTIGTGQGSGNNVNLLVTETSGTGTDGYNEYYLYAHAEDFCVSEITIKHANIWGGFDFQSGLSSSDLIGTEVVNSSDPNADFHIGPVDLGGDLTDGASNVVYDQSQNHVPQARLENDSITVAGNSVSLGGNTTVNHADLSNVSSNDHHARYTDSEAITAINNDADHGSTASHNYFSGNHADLSNVSSNDHHARYTDNEAITAINNDADHGSTASHNYYTDGDATTAVENYDFTLLEAEEGQFRNPTNLGNLAYNYWNGSTPAATIRGELILQMGDDAAGAGASGGATMIQYITQSGERIATTSADKQHNHWGVYTKKEAFDGTDYQPEKRFNIQGGAAEVNADFYTIDNFQVRGSAPFIRAFATSADNAGFTAHRNSDLVGTWYWDNARGKVRMGAWDSGSTSNVDMIELDGTNSNVEFNNNDLRGVSSANLSGGLNMTGSMISINTDGNDVWFMEDTIGTNSTPYTFRYDDRGFRLYSGTGAGTTLNIAQSGTINLAAGGPLQISGVNILQGSVASGNVSLTSGTADIDTGVSNTNATFMLALGSDTNDAKVSGRVYLDSGTGTYHVEIVESGTSVGNPSVDYKVLRVD